LSVLATIGEVLDWFVHSDPKDDGADHRWMLLLLVLACIPLLVLTIANQQWPAAMLIGAGMLIVPPFSMARDVRAAARGVRLSPAEGPAVRHGDLDDGSSP